MIILSAQNKKTSKKSEVKVAFSISNCIAVVYTILMFTVFPFFLSNNYANARRDKFWLYVILTIAAAVLIFFNLFLDYAAVDFKSSFFKKKFSLNLTDMSILAFFVVNLFSTIFAMLRGTSFLTVFIGNEGRNMGLLMISMMVLTYFCVSRYYCSIKYVFYFIFFGISVVSGIAILNYYYLDPLSIFKYYSDNQNVILNFTSTIGNKNYLSALICVALPLSVGVAVSTKDILLRITSLISVAIQFMGLLVATSDGGFLGCFVAFAVMFVFLCRDLKKLSVFLGALAIMLASSKLLWCFDMFMTKLLDGANKGYSSFSEIFIFEHRFVILIPILIGLAVGLYFIKDKHKIVSRAMLFTFATLFICVILVVAGLLMYYNIIAPDAEVGSITSFLRFNDDWGTHRGFFWIRSFELFENFDSSEKLFGSGPETFKIIFQPYFEELDTLYGEDSVNAAHSVYINYLVTTGLFGLMSYIMFISSSVIDAFDLARKNPLALAFLGVIVAYVVQDFVNIANPVNTPWLILSIAICQAARYHQNNPENVRDII